MQTSPGKAADMEIRVILLRSIRTCLRMGLTEQAKKLGEESKLLAERIRTHDYKKEDARIARLEELLKPII